jgi:hypothetical protein
MQQFYPPQMIGHASLQRFWKNRHLLTTLEAEH